MTVATGAIGMKMTSWHKYQDFSSFLEKHHDLVLYDVLHHIKAFILFPLNCSCKPSCFCDEQREKVVLTLNTDLYNQALQNKEDPELLYAMKVLWRIPDDRYFRERQGKAYPLWLIEQELERREDKYHFKMVSRIVWALLRLGKTYEVSIFGERQASMKEAIEKILGPIPLKSKVMRLKPNDYLGGEKAHEARFNEYKSVCHFIAAFEHIKKEKKFQDQEASLFLLETPEHIEEFLSLSHWFRKELLSLETRNVKEKLFFSDNDLLPLPSWVNSDKVSLQIEPYQEKLKEIKANTIRIDPTMKKFLQKGK